MKSFERNKEGIFSLLKDDENYIVVNDGKAIKQNINEDEVDVEVVDNYDTSDICKRKRTSEEEEIITYSPFTTLVEIHKSCTLKIIRVNDDSAYSSIVFKVGERVKANIINVYYDVDINTKALVEVICQEKSVVNYTGTQAVSNEFNEKVNFYVDTKASLNINTLSLNKNLVNNKTNIYLYGLFSNAYINNSIINTTGLNQNYDFNIYHWNQETTSELYNYAICKNSSSLKIQSNGIIRQGCSKSKIQQKSKGILLDLTSAIAANPLLCIDEYDVEANHGASIGAIDDDDLFYLMSRGLTRKDAEQLIVKAFVNPMVNKVDDDLIKTYVDKLINEQI